ncbi:MAG: hypothetical protein A2020_11615 [Lentisphaerae bacterium GWF2_45_14]|nr:MAG: hypothetical protein A2020_11615 [Lentisphaerae bacterium GWF2_45_14]
MGNNIIKKISLLLTIGTLQIGLFATDPVFHFNFKDSQGKKEIKDLTGDYECISKDAPMETYKGRLRTDYGAQIYIPCEKLPDISEGFSISVWLLPLPTIYSQSRYPLISKGILWDKLELDFLALGEFPSFIYADKSNNLAQVSVVGSDYGNSFRYEDAKVFSDNLKIPMQKWTHIALTFSKGKVKIYRNGLPLLEKINQNHRSIKTSNTPIRIGAERIKGEEDNYHSSNMLINDIRLYSKAIDDEEVKTVYETEKDSYPEKNINLPSTRNYYTEALKDLDYDLKSKLRITADYERNILPGLLDKNKNKSTGKIVEVNGRIALSLDGKTTFPVAGYSSHGWLNEQAVDQSFEYIRDFAAAGINIEPVGLGSNFVVSPNSAWKGEGEYDFSRLDSVLERFAKANPEIKMIFQIPAYPPKWFQDRYPEEFEEYLSSATSKKKIRWKMSLLYSKKWMDVLDKYIHDIVAHSLDASYSNRIYGYLITAGDAGEFYWPAAFTGGISGYSKTTLENFKEWLRNKYNNDDVLLKKAWLDKEVSFEKLEVPSPESRLESEVYSFREPQKAAAVIDFRRYITDKTFETMERICKKVKEASSFKKFVIVYTGYPILFTGKGQTNHKSGMTYTSKVFNSPYIDILATPNDYVSRRGGQPGLSINPYNGSASLHKKLIWEEEDLRTHVFPKKEFGSTANRKESSAVIKRGFGYSITRGSGLWFFAIAGNAAFHQDEMMETIAKANEISQNSLSKDNSSVAQIAIIFDEKSLLYIASPKNNFLDLQTWHAYEEATRCGAPYDFYLLEDIKNSAMPDYKLYVFLNAYYTDDATREAIAQKVRKNNSVAVWCFAPGFVSPSGLGTETMYQLTGIKLKEERVEKTISLEITDKAHPITKFAKKSNPCTFGPLFYAEDNNAKTLGTADGKPIFVIKEFKEWKSVYSLMPLTAELLTGLCNYAGVHAYSQSGDILTANKSYIMLHTSTSGNKTITLPCKQDVKEAFSGRIVGKGISSFTEENVSAIETLIYELSAPQ